MTSFSLVFLVVFIWLVIITYWFYRLGKHYNQLTNGIDKTNLKEILEEVLIKTKASEAKIEKLEQWCLKLEKENAFCIQKVGLIRFNPFADTGSDQSFVLAILDRNNTGMVISSLHSRAGTRWYAKSVKSGRGIEHELSVEEEKAVKEAK
jgi:hypothetical protein